MEIAYSLTGYHRVIKVYDWYEIQEKITFRHGDGEWKRVHRGYILSDVIRRFEDGTLAQA